MQNEPPGISKEVWANLFGQLIFIAMATVIPMDTIWRVLVVIVVLGLGNWWYRVVLSKRVRALVRKFSFKRKVTREPVKGLIVFLSKHEPNLYNTRPAYKAARYVMEDKENPLQVVWLLGDDDPVLKEIADRIREDIQKLRPSIEVKYFPAEAGRSIAYDPEACKVLTEKAIEDAVRAGFRESEIVLDYTGGTASNTAGMILAGVKPGRRLQVIVPYQKDEKGYAVGEAGGEIVELNIDYEIQKA